MKSKLLKTVDKILKGKTPRAKAKPKARQRSHTPKQKSGTPPVDSSSFTKKGLLTDVFNILTKNQYKDIVRESQQTTDFLSLPDRPETIDISFEVVGEERSKPTYQNDNLICSDVENKYSELLQKYNALKTQLDNEAPAQEEETTIEESGTPPESNFVSLVSLEKIKTNTKIFQNRDNEYSERSVFSILNAVNSNTFNWQELDPKLNESINKINKLRLDVHRENNQLATALLKLDEYLEKLPDSFRFTREYKDTQALIGRYAKNFDTGLKGIANFAPKFNNLGSMNIATIQSNFFGQYSNQKELYSKVKEWVKSNLAGKKVYVSSCDLTIELNWQGLKNDVNEYHPPYIEKLISFGVLEEIIKTANYFKGEQDKRGRLDVKKVHKLISKVEIDNKQYDVIIVCIESSANFIYDHFLLV